MFNIDWSKEPDISRLREAHGLLTRNPPDALRELEALAERGSVASLLYIAEFHMQNGNNNKTNEEKAKYWYSRAAKADFPEACYMLGRLQYKAGDHKAAFAAFSDGAKLGYAPAIYRLAKMYQSGEGGAPMDISEYRHFLELSYSKGHLFSKRDLAGLLLTGKFGLAHFVRGLIMLLGLFVDILKLFVRNWRHEPVFDEQLFA